MNELRVITPTHDARVFDKENYREGVLSRLTNLAEAENYITENVIESDIFSNNDFEEEDMVDIVNSLILRGREVTTEVFTEEIYNHNTEIIHTAMDRLRINIGDDEWVRIVSQEYLIMKLDAERYPPYELVNFATETACREAEEIIYTGMRDTYFAKIIDFCQAYEVELSTDEDSEIYSLLFYSKILNSTSWLDRLSMPSIKKAIMFPALEGIVGDKAFVMDDTLYVPSQLIHGGVA